MRRFLLGFVLGLAAGWLVHQWVGWVRRRAAWTDEQDESAEQIVIPIRPTPPKPAAAEEVIKAYCARCRVKRPMVDPQPETTPTGRAAMRGTCPVCGAGMFRFVKGK
jgi:hypothetical protein